ncbi:MAG: hypothetical protein NT160_02890 [Actinobacteria bacterium]|nr:hypothetical protein [Actinomycetota bacterium]
MAESEVCNACGGAPAEQYDLGGLQVWLCRPCAIADDLGCP